MIWYAEVALFFLVSYPLSLLPLSVARKLGRLLGLGYYHWNKKRRNISIENIRRVMEKGRLGLPQAKGLSTTLGPEGLAKESDMNLGCSVLELVKVYHGRGKSVIGGVKFEGLENYERAKANGKGVMLFTGHCGNWELLALSITMKAGTIGVVGRPLKNPYLYSVLVRLRNKFGNVAIEKRGALRGMLRMLAKGENVGILMDQAVVPEEGFKIDFLGMPAWTTKTPVLIAKRTGAALVPLFIKRVGDGHKIILHPEVALTGDDILDTKRLSSYIEDYIRENPAEWLWIHRRWKRA